MHMLLLLSGLTLACGEKEPEDTSGADGGTADGGADGGAELACEDVAPASCDGTEGCSTLMAWPVMETSDGWCADFGAERVPLGCMDDDIGCGAAETPATTADAPDTCLWLFPSTCLPAGYVACPATALDACP